MADVDDLDDGYDDYASEPDWEPDCQRCNDSGRQYPWHRGPSRRYRSDRGRCPDCNPSPRQVRRAPRRRAWELRQFQRQSGYTPRTQSLIVFDEAPF
jgi:hypothetical protein